MKGTVGTDWIIAYDSTHREHPYAFHCLRCGAMQRFTPPIMLTDWCNAAKAFSRQHQGCRVQEETHVDD